MDYQNHFSDHSENYAQYRPIYPEELFYYLASSAKHHDLLWDCATGNGQAAVGLSAYFKQVVASDRSRAQIQEAPPVANIQYEVWSAEQTQLADHSVDMVTVAQALHWFNFEKFYAEVKRVLKPGGLLAAWCYAKGHVTPEVDSVVDRLYEEILGDIYWSPERRFIDHHYQTIPFPFDKIETPIFVMKKNYNYEQFLGYLSTWSAVKEYQQKIQQNPLDLIKTDLQKAFRNEIRTMIWPIYLLLGK